MSQLILLNKPYGVICQFSEHPLHPTLKSCVPLSGVYPAGRLDTDSEGLLLLTGEGPLQHRISDPRWKLPKTYWVQVEGQASDEQLAQLRAGVDLGDFTTQPAQARRIDAPELWERKPPVRFRKTVPDCWLEIVISEGKNRQVRRMTAKVGLPTLRLVRVAIGPWRLDGLLPGEMRSLEVNLEDLPRVQHAGRGGKPGDRPQQRQAPQSAKGVKTPAFRFARGKKP
ncbi:pseudouridine synthase [Chromobacterium sphagni]|uniref:Pseudouridine synthase n=1 Tax=Chromobacterium sphagni TaxID=1903179 RepID=A0A1S1X0S1_9NEIS|nr:pseudouridine synthase [Chromobacterium sphagni]OHX13005.1 pseudouridine synthase [Chromobacterium sphagni]OHX19275.1 pseudouridine synthase [Chromobacterium sphagni]